MEARLESCSELAKRLNFADSVQRVLVIGCVQTATELPAGISGHSARWRLSLRLWSTLWGSKGCSWISVQLHMWYASSLFYMLYQDDTENVAGQIPVQC